MAKVAVVLAGCGYLDGAEIREAVLALTALDKAGAVVTIFAPDIPQHHVVNHLTGEEASETRNVLVESARIARGQVSDLAEAEAEAFDALVLPGGFGAAKNLSDLAFAGKEAKVLPALQQLIVDFLAQHKPIGAICIAPAVLTAAVAKQCTPKVTLGQDADGLITALGGEHADCATAEMVVDAKNHITSTPAYMQEAPLAEVAEGIEALVAEVLQQVNAREKAA